MLPHSALLPAEAGGWPTAPSAPRPCVCCWQLVNSIQGTHWPRPCENCHPSQGTRSGGPPPAGGWSPALLRLPALPPGVPCPLQGAGLCAETLTGVSQRRQEAMTPPQARFRVPPGRSPGLLRGGARSAHCRPADSPPGCFSTSGCSPGSALLPPRRGNQSPGPLLRAHLLLWANTPTSVCTVLLSGCTWAGVGKHGALQAGTETRMELGPPARPPVATPLMKSAYTKERGRLLRNTHL